jgi:hypothetical protein
MPRARLRAMTFGSRVSVGRATNDIAAQRPNRPGPGQHGQRGNRAEDRPPGQRVLGHVGLHGNGLNDLYIFHGSMPAPDPWCARPRCAEPSSVTLEAMFIGSPRP